MIWPGCKTFSTKSKTPSIAHFEFAKAVAIPYPAAMQVHARKTTTL
jgi:hypothetical protein